MSRLENLFRNRKEHLLNVFCTAGFPKIDSTGSIMLSLQQHGADIIEIGMPYSDPVADGPVIQQSNMIALANGMTIPLLFEQLRNIKTQINIPVVLMGYLNPVLQYGIELFCKDAVDAGVDAVILPDLPMESYKRLYKSTFDKYALSIIFLITPETSNKRIIEADKLSSGYLYAVAASATTGTEIAKQPAPTYFEKFKKMKLKNPVMIGFGIKDHVGFLNACSFAAGGIIGSAYIKVLLHSNNTDEDTKQFIRSIRTSDNNPC